MTCEETKPERIQPFYQMAFPGERITVIDKIDATIKQDLDPLKPVIVFEGKLSIFFDWSPSILYWEFDTIDKTNHEFYNIFQFGKVTLETDVITTDAVLSDAGVSRVAGGFTGHLELGSDHKIDKVIFHIPDYLYLHHPGKEYIEIDTTESPDSPYHEKRWTETILEADGWTIRLQPVRNYDLLRIESNKRQKSVLSGIGQISKSNLEQFKKKEVRPVLNALNVFLSFAFAEWSPPLLVVGSNEHTTNSCQFLRGFDIVHKSYSQGWLDEDRGDDLTQAFPGFFKLWKKKNWREPLKLTVQWLIEATRRSGGTEGAIAFGQIPLEMLASLVFVDDRSIIESGELDKLSAASKLQLLLDRCGIPFEVPAELTTLNELIKRTSVANGPQLVTEVRNKIIHPIQKNRDIFQQWEQKYNIRLYDIFWETHELLKWYITLVLLNLIGYSGFYANRLSLEYYIGPQRVPWAVSEEDESS
ncbi:hypothetical protein [Gimesia panareensis]|uniref:hypothetical protein n=1 Tax=Gimesia panareensis TaxID=2527978 RepID=UPI001189AC5A|nr:hypothetical protein [Gimesia panareensis]QDU53128.1 hypothetical protein Pan110_55120 [Gimesia panareensis]